MSNDAPVSIGIDIGGTHLRAALVDAQGRVVHVSRHLLTARDPAAILGLMRKGVAELCQKTPAAAILPLGVGFAGQIWLRSGTIAVAPNLGWRDVPFGSMLHEAFGPRVRMVNDLNAIAVGEAACGAGLGCRELVCVFVGTGVGMGAVAAGQVVEGADGLATELGHIKVASVVDGRRCGCGERGCLEAYAGGRHLPELLAELAERGTPSPYVSSLHGDLSQVSAGSIDAAAAAGDPAALALWEQTATRLSLAIGNVITLFNPAMLVLGGGVLRAAPRLHQLCREQIPAYAATPAQTHLKICATALGDDAGIIGAALVAVQTQTSRMAVASTP